MSKGARGLTATVGRHAAITDALKECPVGRWVKTDEFFRYMRATGFDFEVTRDPWELYIEEQEYGSLGYEGFGKWSILQGRYALCFLFEYAATLGVVDVAHVPPEGARQDFSDLWGADDLEFFSRYDGLLYFRLTPLGEYCLGLTEKYVPAHTTTRATISMLPSLKVSVTGEALLPEERHEYLDGQIYAMAGESPEHGAICTNLGGQLYAQLRGKSCQAFSKDIKVRSGPAPKLGQTTKGLYSYPDLPVVCGELKFHDEHRDVLLNPAVIIEVLSTATEAFDRGEKWARYQTWLTDLTDYLLVSQTKPRIEHFLRRAGGEWLYSFVDKLGDSLRLDSIGCVLQLTDVYDRIIFPVEEPEDLSE